MPIATHQAERNINYLYNFPLFGIPSPPSTEQRARPLQSTFDIGDTQCKEPHLLGNRNASTELVDAKNN